MATPHKNIGRLLIWESLKYFFPQNPTILRIRASPVKSDTTLVLNSSSSSSWCLPSREMSPFRRQPRAFSSTSSPPQKFRKVTRELSDPFFPPLLAPARPPALLRRRSQQSRLTAVDPPCRGRNRVPGIARYLPVQNPR